MDRERGRKSEEDEKKEKTKRQSWRREEANIGQDGKEVRRKGKVIMNAGQYVCTEAMMCLWETERERGGGQNETERTSEGDGKANFGYDGTVVRRDSLEEITENLYIRLFIFRVKITRNKYRNGMRQ